MDELKRDDRGRFVKGTGSPAGFRQHPENKANGSWHKEDTPRYWLESMMKLTRDELRQIVEDETQPMFRQKIAKCLYEGDWKVIREMIEEVYGKMPQAVINIGADSETEEEAQKFIKGFVLP